MRYPAAIALILLLAAAVAAVNTGDALPLEEHEVFVARTADVMTQRHAWLVPDIGDRIRLEKPPLAYWSVMVVEKLGNRDGSISPREARVPSIIAAVVLALVTLAIGLLLYDRLTALVAMLLLVAGSGYVEYAHSARPEMQYAAWCGAGIVCFLLALRRAERGRRALGFAWLAWVMMGMAVLTKGPQMPVLIAVGLTIGLWRTGRAKLILPALRPVTGVVIAAAVSAWWYAAVWQRVHGSGAAWSGEWEQKIVWDGWSAVGRWLTPTYLFDAVMLALPWGAMYPAALIGPWIVKGRQRDATRLLWWVLIASMIGLSLAFSRKSYYLLPVLAPLCVLMAAGGLRVARLMAAGGQGQLWRSVLILHAVGLGVATIALWWLGPHRPAAWAVTLATAASGAAVGFVLSQPMRSRASVAVSLAAVLAAGAVFMGAMAAGGALWGPRRYEMVAFIQRLPDHVEVGQPLVMWSPDGWYTANYYLDRDLPVLNDAAALHALLDAHPTVWAVMRDGRPPQLPGDVTSELVLRADENGDGEEDQVLVRLTR